jgi:type IV secretory pathway VirD2 relaxase
VMTSEEREFRLRPRKPPVRSERATYAVAYKTLMHYARTSRSCKSRPTGSGGRPKRTRAFSQRCAVRVTYTKNASKGQWRAHGRYIARESATLEGKAKNFGFDGNGESVDIAERLGRWQKANDERLWKLIISPEFGERADLKQLTRAVVSRMGKDLGTPLEWVAAAHYNTEHPHVHLALRGVDAGGRALNIGHEYIKHGIRAVAEDLCTLQLGHRTQLDADLAQRREVHQPRYTSLDRIIQREAEPAEADVDSFAVLINNKAKDLKPYVAERLKFLHSMGLAEPSGGERWRVRQDFASVLRSMQQSADRQRMFAAHGAPMSDERLPVAVLDLRRLSAIEGRILVHGEEEAGRRSGRNYLMLEGTDALVYHIHYTPEMEDARSRGGLRTNAFVRLTRRFVDGHPSVVIHELGDSESILRDKVHLMETVHKLIRRGVVPHEDGWNGWLGRYQKAIREEATGAEDERPIEHPQRKRDLERGR